MISDASRQEYQDATIYSIPLLKEAFHQNANIICSPTLQKYAAENDQRRQSPVNDNTYNKVQLYTLHARKLYDKLSLPESLRLGAILVENWLHDRLGAYAPPQLQHHSEDYRQTIPGPRHLSNGYMIDTVSEPDCGVWAVRFIYPQSVPDADTPSLTHSITVEENIGFAISGSELHCGICVTAYGLPKELSASLFPCPVPVPILAQHPLFGLKTTVPIKAEAIEVDTQGKFNQLLSVCKDVGHQLPTVVFTPLEKKTESAQPIPLTSDDITGFLRSVPDGCTLPRSSSKLKPVVERNAEDDPGYDIDAFSRDMCGHAWVCVINHEYLAPLSQYAGVSIRPGDIVFLPCVSSSMKPEVFPYRDTEKARQRTLHTVKDSCTAHQSGLIPQVGPVAFFAEENRVKEQKMQSIRQKEQAYASQLQARLDAQAKQNSDRINQLQEENDQLRKQISNLKEYSSSLEKDKSNLLDQLDQQKKALLYRDRADAEEIQYLRRTLDRPADHTGIAAWTEKHFSDHLVIVPKAAAMLNENSAKAISLPLICDALDFLATDYWENRFARLPWEQVLDRCSAKYGRPFEVGQISNMAIEYTPSQYKVKYFKNENGKRYESPLNQHLKVGNDPENLLRIYFLLDESGQKIVVGSLPKHLKAINLC